MAVVKNSNVSGREYAKLKTNPLTGGIGLLDQSGQKVSAGSLDGNKIRTFGASYTGTGTAFDVDLGIGVSPVFVIAKANNASYPAVVAHRATWFRQTDSLTDAAASKDHAITLTKNGFTVGTDGSVNSSGVTYNYFALCVISGQVVVPLSWHGNATAGRVIDQLAGLDIAAVISKRDATQQPVLTTKSGSWLEIGTSGSYMTINSDGTLTLDASDYVNQWYGVAGEGCNNLAFLDDPENVAVINYTGNNTARKIPVPWEPGLVMIWPKGATSSKVQIYMQGMPSGNSATSNAATFQTGRITAVDAGSVSLAAQTSVNANGIGFTMLCIRKSSDKITPADYVRPAKAGRKAIQLATGYIDCGTSNTLALNGAYTEEFYGAFWPADETPFAGGAGVNDELNKQYPLMWRSIGADGGSSTVTTSWGMALACPGPYGPGGWTGCGIMVPTFASMNLPQNVFTNLDYHPMQTGYVIDGGRIAHIQVAHYGDGKWAVVVDGVLVKTRNRKLLTAVAGPLKPDGASPISGARTVFGARLRGTGTPEFAHNMQFRLARVYSRGLSLAEMVTRYRNVVLGESADVSDFVEEWDANNASGSTLYATKNSANNGTIVNGTVF